MTNATDLTIDEFPNCVAIGHSYPYQAGHDLEGKNYLDVITSGVLYAPDVVISAAHGMKREPTHVFTGANAYNATVDGGQEIKVKKSFRFNGINLALVRGTYRDIVEQDVEGEGRVEGTRYRHLYNDICIMILEEPSLNFEPTPIASKDDLDEAIGASQVLTAVGYGKSDYDAQSGVGQRRKGQIEILKIVTETDANTYGCNLGLELVAQDSNQDAPIDTCDNDSGGPIYINVEGQMALAGITSRKTKPAKRQCGDGGVYTRLDPHINWIESVIEDLRNDRIDRDALAFRGVFV